MNVSFILPAVAVMILSGCAEQTAFQRQLGSWVGSNETQLTRSWGQPDKIISQGHTRYLAYNQSGPPKSGGQSHPTTPVVDCLITFESLDEIIVSSRYEGENCPME